MNESVDSKNGSVPLVRYCAIQDAPDEKVLVLICAVLYIDINALNIQLLIHITDISGECHKNVVNLLDNVSCGVETLPRLYIIGNQKFGAVSLYESCDRSPGHGTIWTASNRMPPALGI
jgi:hypothetical protein